MFLPGMSNHVDIQRQSPPFAATPDSGVTHTLFRPWKSVCGRHGHRTTTGTCTTREASAVVASIGKIASPSQGASYFERDVTTPRDTVHESAARVAESPTADLFGTNWRPRRSSAGSPRSRGASASFRGDGGRAAMHRRGHRQSSVA